MANPNIPTSATTPASGFSSSKDFFNPKGDLPGRIHTVDAPNVAPENGRHYCVLCNLPNGLTCQVDDKRIKLKGSAHYLMPNPNRKYKGLQPHEAIFGASMNFVDKDFWDKWVAQMTDKAKFPDGFGPITNGQIVWHQHKSEATLIRKDAERVMSGFEQLNPEKHGVTTDNKAPSMSNVLQVTE